MEKNKMLHSLVLTSMLAGGSAAALAHEPVKSLVEQERKQRQNVVRLQAPDEQTYVKALISLHSELLAANKEQHYLIVNVSDKQLQELQGFGFKSEVATEWLAKRDEELEQKLHSFSTTEGTHKSQQSTSNDTIPGFSCYATVEGTFSAAQSLASQYPQLVEMIDIGDSWDKAEGNGGYDLWVMKITNQTISKDKPKLFIHSAMHAREYTPAALTLDFATDILENYESNADAHWILNEHEIHILFHMNPDGRKVAETGILWRKNNNVTHCPEGLPGVDLNRNFTQNWGVTTNGSSGEACDNDFRGPSPGSEPETAAVEEYVRGLYPDLRGPEDTDAAPEDTSGMYIDIHSFSELILWPWGHTGAPAPNGDALEMLGRKIAFFNGYVPIQGVGLYPTDGTSFGISYGELGIASIAYELGTEFFQSCAEYENTIRPRNMSSLYYAAKVVSRPYQLPFGADVRSLDVVASNDNSVTLNMLAGTRLFNNNFGGNVTPTNVAEVEYYINETPWDANSAGIGLSAADGAFDNVSEQVEATIDTSALEDGRHILYFRAKDAQNRWGPVTAQFIEVGASASNVAPSPSIQIACDDLACQFDASQSTDDGSITSYQWNISDDTQLEGVSVSHTFGAEGTYEIILTITDDDGVEASMSQSVTVTEPAPPPVSPPPPPTNPDPVDPTPPASSDSGGGSLSFVAMLLLSLFAVRRRLK